MTLQELLSQDVVAFLMRAVLDDRVSRVEACSLIAPWVEGDAPSEQLAEDGAQLLHGFDITLDEMGRQVHRVVPDNDASYSVAREAMRKRAQAWLGRAEGS